MDKKQLEGQTTNSQPQSSAERFNPKDADFKSDYDSLHKRFKEGVMNKQTLDLAIKLARILDERRGELRDSYPREYYYGICMCAETLDHFGRTRESVRLLRLESDLLLDFNKWTSERTHGMDREQKRLYRDKARLVAVYAGTVFSRQYDGAVLSRHREYRKALNWIIDCLEALERLSDDDFPCHGTLAQLNDLRAKCHRQLHEFDQAEEHFRRGIEHYFKRAQRRALRREGEPYRPEELSFALRRTAVLLSRLAWMTLQRGHVRRAETLILTAQLLLLNTQDEINRGYTLLIHASILRAVDNDDIERLDRSINLARQAETIFAKHGHDRYQIRAIYERALCHFQRGGEAEAEALASRVKAWAEGVDSTTWVRNALLILSRVALRRNQLGLGLELADEALRKADDQVTTRIDALITRSEALLEFGESAKTKEARAALQEALRLNHSHDGRGELSKGQSARVDAEIHLLTAQAYLKEGLTAKATPHFNAWKRLENQIEQTAIRRLAQKVADELEAQSLHFTIDITPDMSLDYEEYRPRLLRFLIQRARERVELRMQTQMDRSSKRARVSKEMIANELKITRQTLGEWEKLVAKWESKELSG